MSWIREDNTDLKVMQIMEVNMENGDVRAKGFPGESHEEDVQIRTGEGREQQREMTNKQWRKRKAHEKLFHVILSRHNSIIFRNHSRPYNEQAGHKTDD